MKKDVRWREMFAYRWRELFAYAILSAESFLKAQCAAVHRSVCGWKCMCRFCVQIVMWIMLARVIFHTCQ